MAPITLKERYRKAILLFYKLIASREPKSVFTGPEIVQYIQEGLGRNSLGRLSILAIVHTRQLRYHVYRRVSEGVTYYIYVRRSEEEIANQIKNFKSYER